MFRTARVHPPLYQQIKDKILQKINSSEWPAETRVPSEIELVDVCKASRMTVNRALRELAAEGYIVRIQGSGTFVAPPKSSGGFFEIGSIADEIVGRGGVHTCDVVLLRTERASLDICLGMNIKQGEWVYHSIILHRENNTPIQCSERFVNTDLAPEYIKQDFTRIIPSRYLLEVVPFTEAEHVIEAVLPNYNMKKLLQLKRHEPCLILHRKTWLNDVVISKSIFTNPASRCQFKGKFKNDERRCPRIA
ncbi:histidine utilization repressor [bacterium]|nr:histidine utilization repressor [bacterium]